ATANTWLPACCTVVMLSPRRFTLLLPPSRPRGLSSLSTGALPVSRLVSASSLRNLSPTETSPRSRGLCKSKNFCFQRYIGANNRQMHVVQYHRYLRGLDCLVAQVRSHVLQACFRSLVRW